jgi:hypothetical protein
MEHVSNPLQRAPLTTFAQLKKTRSMKSAVVQAICFSYVFILSIMAYAQPVIGVQTNDQFPEKAVWMNIDHKLVMDNLKEKIAILVISDERSVECGYYLRQLESM